MNNFYCGIGSRISPPEILAMMTNLASYLERCSMILRSGGAEGADTAFQKGVCYVDNMSIFIPWNGFNGLYHDLTDGVICLDKSKETALREIAKKYHPAWDRCSQGAQKLHTRNVLQILGEDGNTPCSFVICWTPKGNLEGGTAQALRIAIDYKIPIYNLGNIKTRFSIQRCPKYVTNNLTWNEDLNPNEHWVETRYV